jgi:hypothetical protein
MALFKMRLRRKDAKLTRQGTPAKACVHGFPFAFACGILGQ